MTDYSLEGRSAIVTGGGSGIGRACAQRLASDGAAVVLVGRSEERLTDAIGALVDPPRHRYVAGDVGEEATMEQAVSTAQALAPLGVALANAGSGGLGPLIATPADEFDRVMRTNLNGTFFTFKHAGAAIARAGGGAMCAISSIAGLRTHRFMGPYCTSKAAIDMLVRNTADELGIAGVRVNSVCPGLVATELAEALFDEPTVHDDYLDCMPIRRTGVVDDIANAVGFLCSAQASWITGVNLPVDGGHHLRRGPNVEPFARALYGDDLAEGRA
ncbi:MAG: glucose 1-dehydrogenase [Pseudomonadales bacterium]|jgi:NAD(P)-dependent dehydrogenase (short-subunit alcohol dehydrogenase family)|nr:glucose 1-dehydrogenase [Pseudomonadales bacterium]MDP6473226.1 glucose 1-dehydrogenase [Pseudomonadales bacterium]MDP6826013.1 glucose 1-dehydrogenase [Pseudomonadales bacterium]MDP6971659.1 glucose 1-dehydrogenase [Pseudomonadales bacterium]